jgi:hypothetical protein
VNLGTLAAGSEITIGLSQSANGGEQFSLGIGTQANPSQAQININLAQNSNEQIVLNLLSAASGARLAGTRVVDQIFRFRTQFRRRRRSRASLGSRRSLLASAKQILLPQIPGSLTSTARLQCECEIKIHGFRGKCLTRFLRSQIIRSIFNAPLPLPLRFESAFWDPVCLETDLASRENCFH